MVFYYKFMRYFKFMRVGMEQWRYYPLINGKAENVNLFVLCYREPISLLYLVFPEIIIGYSHSLQSQYIFNCIETFLSFSWIKWYIKILCFVAPSFWFIMSKGIYGLKRNVRNSDEGYCIDDKQMTPYHISFYKYKSIFILVKRQNFIL